MIDNKDSTTPSVVAVEIVQEGDSKNPVSMPFAFTNAREQSSGWRSDQPGFQLTAEDISLVLQPTAKAKKKKGAVDKIILDKVNCSIMPGRMFAIMGPSGSGKSSLLNVLAGRTAKSKGLSLFGRLKVNGSPVDHRTYRRICAYVQQDDCMFSNLTVLETLTLAAKFRLPRSFTDEQRMESVNSIISELGLAKSRNTIIGDERKRGISGGEKKRVNIGVEIIASPAGIFLDEPTSGLDAFQALNVMKTISKLARKGRTVVASIHQPRSSIMLMVEDLLLLSEGNVMYCGPFSQCLDFFRDQGFNCPSNFNPADFIVDVVSMNYQDLPLEIESRENITKLANGYTRSPQMQEYLEWASGASHVAVDAPKASKHKYEATYWMQFQQLFKRSLSQKFRDKPALIIPAVSNVFFGVLLGLIYLQTGYSQIAIQDRVGVLFFAILNQFFGGMFGIINTFPIERTIILRERAAKSYSASVYFAAKFLSDVPLNVCFPTIFAVILYWMIGLNQQAWEDPNGDGPTRFVLFLVLLISVYFCASAFGLLISSLAGSVQAASALAPPLAIFFVLFGGFYANTENIPAFIAWLQYVSPLRYAFSGGVVNEFENVEFECPNEDKAECRTQGNTIIYGFGFANDSIGKSIGIILLMTVIFNCLGYLSLRFKKTKFLEPLDRDHGFVSPVRTGKYPRAVNEKDT